MKTKISTIFPGWMAGGLWTILFCVRALGSPLTEAASNAGNDTVQQRQGDAQEPAQPVITSVRVEGTEIIVTVKVPAGIRKVTLESRLRLAAGTWAPVDVARLDGQGSTITFRVNKSERLEVLRVRADAREDLPGFFYSGATNFAGATSPTTDSNLSGVDNKNGTETTPTAGFSSPTREVVESDIWQIDGNTLYFFNQYRGLQVIDISKAEAPVIRGTLELPASGEQMYLLDASHVVLMTRNWCSGTESQILVVKITDGIPALENALPVSGYIQESRLVGTALYVASQAYRQKVGDVNGNWEWGTQVTSFDLANPAQPVKKDTIWNPGYGNVVSATDQYLFVCAQDINNWRYSQIRIIDIAAPDGTMKALSSIATAGTVKDKFKMQVKGSVFTVISELWSDTRRWVTTLETFSLADPAKPVKLGNLELAAGETLHATRFDGDRVYVVTFFRIDPLWIVDLSNPAQPAIKGELQVPGWSTYIQPYGDRLVTIGIDNSNSWRVAVSLFDVADVTKPGLVSKVPLGENYSWSEATYDEKAFNIMPEAGLILVPYQGSTTNGYANRVQLIDLNLADHSTNALKLRGVIDHELQPRRATLHNDRVLSLSGWELMSVDATDRDKPKVLSVTELSWPVERVLLAGDYLLEVASQGWSYWWGGAQTPPAIRVTMADNPSVVLSKTTLPDNLGVAAAVIRNGKLYVAQANGGYYPIYWLNAKTDGSSAVDTNPPSLLLSVFDLSGLPALVALGQEQVKADNFGANSMQALWPKDDVLVLGGGNSYYGWGYWDIGVMRTTGPAAALTLDARSSLWGGPWYGGYNGGRLFAFNVADAAKPKLVSEVSLQKTNCWSFSQAYGAGTLAYISHQESEFLEGVLPAGQAPPKTTVVYDDKTGIYATNQPVYGMWVYHHYLEVVDYDDPANPRVRKPVIIPSALVGVSHNGAVVYTVGNHWKSDGNTDWTDWLDALAYDGVSAHLVDSMNLPAWPHPLVVQGNHLFLGHADNSTNNLHSLETWTLDNTGHFQHLGGIGLNNAAASLNLFGDLLAAYQYNPTYMLFDARDPAALKQIGASDGSQCYWSDVMKADGAVDRGLWLPMGDYGVKWIPVKK